MGEKIITNSEYLRACDVEGGVDYNRKAKTYRLVFLDTFTVPCREDSELESPAHVQGEMTAPRT